MNTFLISAHRLSRPDRSSKPHVLSSYPPFPGNEQFAVKYSWT